MKKTYQVYLSADLHKVETSFGFFQIKCTYNKAASDVKLFKKKKNWLRQTTSALQHSISPFSQFIISLFGSGLGNGLGLWEV